MKYDHTLNADRSTDARKGLTPKAERVTQLKTSKNTANGQYNRESSTIIDSKLVTYRYLPNQVFRKYSNGKEIPILEKIGDDWFPCDGVVIKDSEFHSMQSFPGAYGMDVDALQRRYKRRSVSSTSKTTNVSGRSHYRCDNATYQQVEQNLMDADIRRHNAKKQKAILCNVQINNVKRKK